METQNEFLRATVAGQQSRRFHDDSTPAVAWKSLLLVGPEAHALKSQAATLPVSHVATADSFIEAILVAGQSPRFDIIIAGIGNELPHLKRAVESLRTICPKARMILLCSPADEPQARRTLNWGADNYEILPVTLDQAFASATRSAQPQLELQTRHTLASSTVVDGSPAHLKPQINLASLPLVMQTSMLDTLMQGQPNLVDRALAILQSYLRWPGKLKVHKTKNGETASVTDAPEIPEDQALHQVPIRYQRDVVGQLELSGAPGPLAPALAAQLDQAASWLGGWIALARQAEQLRTLAVTDELTGAFNRRYFRKFVKGLLEKARTERFRVTLLMFDIDNFKTYNDRFGHAAGDSIIRQLITLLRSCTRERDLVARIGGDEFAVVFWDAEAPRQPNSQHPRDAVAATERFRKAIASHKWEEQCSIKGCVSISGGIASYPWQAETLDELLATADAAMLQAKATGKNVIVLHGADEKFAETA